MISKKQWRLNFARNYTRIKGDRYQVVNSCRHDWNSAESFFTAEELHEFAKGILLMLKEDS